MKLRIPFLAILTLASLVHQDSRGQNRLTPEMLVDLDSVSSAQLSPDGEHIAYIVRIQRSPSDPPGGAYSVLKIARADGEDNGRQYTRTPGSVSSVHWTPDGRALTFLARREGDDFTQLYQIEVRGGEARRVFKHSAAIQDYSWSPDGAHIAFSSIDAETDDEKKAKKEGRDWNVVNQNHRYRHLWAYNVKNKYMEKIVGGKNQVWSHVWAPGGEMLYLQVTDTPLVDDSYMYRRIMRVSLDGTGLALLTRTEGKLDQMLVSPDGSHLAFLGAERLNDSLAHNVWVASTSDGTSRNLTKGMEFSAVQLSWLSDQEMLVLTNRGTRTPLIRVRTDGQTSNEPDPGVILASFDVHPESLRLAAVASTPTYPSEVHSGRLDDLPLIRRTRHNPLLDGVRLARQEVVSWTGPGELSLEGILTYPLDYNRGRRYPLVLQVHGGPEGIDLDGWKSRALYPVQLLAAEGYFVLQPNYRGSGGRGTAFSTADHDDLGGAEYDDVLAGIDYLVSEGLVDPDRVATGGFSYGGYFSAWAATRHSERFKAAVVGAGITNWVSFTGTSDIPYENSIVHWNQWWFDNPALHWQRSPLSHINKAQTPTLIIHGVRDERVPPTQSIELYTALRVKEVPVELVLYPREPHGLRERAHQLDYIERTLGWFRKYLD